MKRMIGFAAIALSLGVAGCYSPPPSPVEQQQGYVIQPQGPDEHAVFIAPTAPPPPQAEMAPPPPNGQVGAVYWVPGNWQWLTSADGHSGWSWFAGHYVNRPSRTATFEPGHWQQSNAGYVWIDGYWR